MAFSYWQTGNFAGGVFRAPANQGAQGTIRNDGFCGYGYQNYALGKFGRDDWNKWAWSGSCLKSAAAPAATGTRPWIPSDLPAGKLGMWLKGDDLSGSNGSNVTSWADANGGTNNATGGANKPTLVTSGLNGMNTVAFAQASSQYFSLPSGLLSGRTSSASFAVFKRTNDPPASGAETGPIFGDWGADTQNNHNPWTDGVWYEDYCYNTRVTVGGVPASTAWRILGLRSKNNDFRLDMNGTNYATNTSFLFGVSSTPLLGRTDVLSGGGSTYHFDGQIAEVVDCADFLTTAEKEQVEGYLAWKWGIQALLPGGHTYASAAPTVTIAGTTITAVASPALDTFLSASAAKALIEGLGSGTLNAFSTSALAKVRIKGAASVALSPFSSAATAAVRVKAAASPFLGTFLSASAAKILVEGAGSGILSAFGTTSTAKVRVKAAASISPSPFNTTATAHVVSSGITATVSVSLSPFTSAAAAKGLIEGVGGGTLNAFASTSSAKVRIKAAASLQLGVFTAAVSAKVRLKASAAVALSPFTASGTAVPITPASVPNNRTTHAPARVSNSVAPSGLRTTYAPRKAA